MTAQRLTFEFITQARRLLLGRVVIQHGIASVNDVERATFRFRMSLGVAVSTMLTAVLTAMMTAATVSAVAISAATVAVTAAVTISAAKAESGVAANRVRVLIAVAVSWIVWEEREACVQ